MWRARGIWQRLDERIYPAIQQVRERGIAPAENWRRELDWILSNRAFGANLVGSLCVLMYRGELTQKSFPELYGPFESMLSYTEHYGDHVCAIIQHYCALAVIKTAWVCDFPG